MTKNGYSPLRENSESWKITVREGKRFPEKGIFGKIVWGKNLAHL